MNPQLPMVRKLSVIKPLNLNLFLILLLFILWLFSCKETNPRTIKTWVSMSDTMFQRLVNEEQPHLDSLCIKRTDSIYRIAYDSIYQKRLGEIRQLLDSNKINEPIR